MTLGEKILVLRKQNGMSQEQLAEKITVSRQAISRWELNESIPDVDNIVQLSNIFSVSTDYLLTGTGVGYNGIGDDDGLDEGLEKLAKLGKITPALDNLMELAHSVDRADRREGLRNLRKFCLVFGMIAPCIYLVLGFAFGWWHPGWIIIPFPWLLFAGISAIEYM